MENKRKKNQKLWRKMIASIFAFVMTFQAMSGMMDVVAYEMGKVNLSPTTGDYYGVNLNNRTLNTGEGIQGTTGVLRKEPSTYLEEPTYDSQLEIIDKRTVNSKTYQLLDGSYVTETFFEPIHKKEGKTFVEIDNKIENTNPNARGVPLYENKDGSYLFQVQDNRMSMENQNQQRLTIINDSASLDVYDIKDHVILYSEAYKNIDMEYRLSGNAVSTNFFINGKTTTSQITLSIDKGNLKVKDAENAFLFVDDQDQVIYRYTKPLLYDERGEVKTMNISYTEEKTMVHVNMTLDTDMINAKERVYPLTISTRAVDESLELNVDTAYNRSAFPNTTSQYYDLYVGYEDGSTSGGTFLGITRTYVHVSELNLGSNKKIMSAELKLWKKIQVSEQWNTIDIGKTSSYIKPSEATWNNRPNVTSIGTTSVRKDPGWQSFDVLSYVQDIYNGKNNTLELKATNESSLYTPNVFSSESGTGLPRLSMTYRDDYDVNPGLSIDTFDTEMRVFGILNKGFKALSFDGIAKPSHQVIFDLVEQGQDTVIQSVTSKGNANKYFIDPIYITNHINNTQTYPKRDVNYTTDYVYGDHIPEFDVPYEYKVKVKGTTTSTREFRTDSFIKYKVKNGDNLKNIASYYGVPMEDIKTDNNLKSNIIKEDDVLLVRFQKNNPQVSQDVYTPPVRSVEYKAKYVNRGPRCSSGTCVIIDPVNSATGNYYDEEIDLTIKDADVFNFYRYYNSTGPQLSNMFGNGFTSPIESYISYDKDGNILYFAGDGKIFQFTKTTNGYVSRIQDKLAIRFDGEKAIIINEESETTYRFDVYGYLDTITSKEGVVITIVYDDYGLISSVKVGEKILSLTYNEYKLVKSMTLPSGDKVSYHYDDNRNLISFTDTRGNVKTYHYDDNHYLTSITDKNGNKITQNTYDGEGRVLKQIDGRGNESTLVYKENQTILTKADGTKEVYDFNDDYDIVSVTVNGQVMSQNTYDDKRNIISSTDGEGRETNYTYDAYNQVTFIAYPDGTYEEFKYDVSHNLIYQRAQDGNITENTYQGNDLILTKDTKKNSVTYKYDDKRRIVKETNPFGVSKSYTYKGNMIASVTHSSGLIENYEYDENGNVIKESDNQGKVITYLYHANNEMIQKNYTDGSNEQWTYDHNGNISSYKDRIGGISKNTYDQNNNLVLTTKGHLRLSKEYDELNQLMKETNEQGQSQTYTYDAYGNKKTETNAYGKTTKYEYNTEGKITKTVDPFGNEEERFYENGNLVKTIGKDGLITLYEYDEYNREIKKTNPNQTVETKEYEGLLLKKDVNDKGTIIIYDYDDYDRQIKVTTTYTDGVVLITQNTYDMYGNIVDINQDGVITKNRYDVYNQVIETTNALGQTTKTAYDFDGNVIKETDALGNSVIKTYDGNRNIVSNTDKNGNTERKEYNELGQLIKETDTLGYVTTYTYNEYGQVSSATDPYKRVATYIYDAYQQVVEMKLENQVIEAKEYDEYGRVIKEESQEAKMTYVYDDFNRVIAKTNELTGLTMYTTYDRFGNVIEDKDSEGLTTTKTYDQYQRLIESQDSYGRKEKTTYNDRNQVIQTQGYDGLSQHYDYDVHGNVIENIDGYGKVTKNTYDCLGRLIKVESGNKITETVYDGNGQVIEIKNINNQTSTKTEYDKNGNIIKETDALGYSLMTTYDAKNQVISKRDALGGVTTKEYDAYGNVIKDTDALGHSKQYQFNAYGLLEKEIDERGFDVTYEYNDDFLVTKIIDSQGNIMSIDYNNKRQKVKEVNPNGGVTEYGYDAYGKEAFKKEPNGKVIKTTYDVLGNVAKEESGKKTTVHTYDKLGRLLKTSINGIVQVKNEYNDKNQIIKSYDANNNSSTWSYDQNNQVISSNEKGFVSQKTYDAFGNIVKQIDNQTSVAEHRYDGNNRLIETKVNEKTMVKKVYDGNANEITVIEQGVELRKAYDKNNRLVKVDVPSSLDKNTFVSIQKITYDESGNALSVTDGNGGVIYKTYDAFHNVIEEVNKNGIKTLYEYDGMNNIVKVQNHTGRNVSYVYNTSNDMIFKTINKKQAEYRYDLEHNQTYEKNENGYVSEKAYDVFGNVLSERKPDGTVIKSTYDKMNQKITENNNRFTYDQRGNVLTSTNKEGTVVNTYDLFNNKTSVTDTNGKTVTYTFNQDNQLTHQKYAGIDVSYTYNHYGQIETVKKGKTVIGQYTYNARNEVVKLVQEKTITEKAYDNMGRVTSQKTTKGNQTILEATYAYDANDNLIKESINGKENMYTYDAYDELAESQKYVNGKRVKTTYQRDAFGNQIENSSSEGKKVFTYNDKNQVESIETKEGMITYRYDDNGNVSKKVNEDGRVDLYTYDEFNRLIQLNQDHYVYDYRYDAEGERVEQVKTDTRDYHYDQWYTYQEPLKVVSDQDIKETFDNLREQVSKKEDNGNTCTSLLSDTYDVTYYQKPEVTTYILDRNREYTEVIATNDNVHVYGDILLQSGEDSIITGWNESVVAKVKEEKVQRLNYDDYGYTEDIKSGHGYNGEMLDATGLIYLRARYYDPNLSRFVQIDTNYEGEKGSVISQNKYVYTLNNPYKYVDRNGNWSLFKAVGNVARKVVDTVKKAVTSVVKSVVSFLSGIPKTISQVMKNVTKTIQGTLQSVMDGIGGNASRGKSGGFIHLINRVKNNLRVLAMCPQEEKIATDEKNFYSFIDKPEYSTLVSNAKSNAISAIAGMSKKDAKNRAEKAMEFFDAALHAFKKKVGYDMENDTIIIDYLVTAVLDVAIKVVKEYKEPKYTSTSQIQTTTMSQPYVYKIYSTPDTVSKNVMFYNLVQSRCPYDIKNRAGWEENVLGEYSFNGSTRANDYLGNYMYGVVGKEMFADINFSLFGGNIGTDSYLLNMAGLAQQYSNHGTGLEGAIFGGASWIWIRISSGFSETGDNEEDVQMIKDGIERWYRDYGKEK